MRPVDVVDVVVIGGGPAGATAARLLTAWGHSVVLLTGSERRSPGLAESLPPSIRKLLGFVGARDAVDAAGFLPSDGNTSWWGDATPRAERFGELRGYQVHRPQFDRVLLDLAASAGVNVRAGTARTVITEGLSAPRVDYIASGDARAVSGRFVLDSSGRAGVVARRGLRVPEPGHETLALSATWQRDRGWEFPPSHTLVETFEDGWVWSIPLSPSIRHLTVMIDADLARRSDPASPDERYLAALARTRVLGTIPQGAIERDAVWGCDASLYSARAYVASRCLLVGDAGSFIDPLSSYGVKKALASAWMAAVAVHTSLARPDRESMALAYFDERGRQIYASYLAEAVRYFRDAARRHAGAFWQRRSGTPVLEETWDLNEDALRADPDVLRAFDELKRRHAVQLTPGDNVRCEMRPAIVGNEIALEETLIGPGIPAGTRFLGGVHLPTLLRMAPSFTQVPDLFERYNEVQRPVGLPDFLGALSVLVGKGALGMGPQ